MKNRLRPQEVMLELVHAGFKADLIKGSQVIEVRLMAQPLERDEVLLALGEHYENVDELFIVSNADYGVKVKIKGGG